jgi:hypothetical protein
MKKSGNAKKNANTPSRLIDARIAALGDWRGETLARVRALIKEADPEVVEAVKWRKPSNATLGVPVWENAGIVCTGETYKDKVKLTFAKGASLEDPSGLFNASSTAAPGAPSIWMRATRSMQRRSGRSLAPPWRSIANHVGLAEEAFEQSFGLLACRTSGSAAPTASLRTASMEMGGCRTRWLLDVCRCPGERGLGRRRQDQGADRN